MRLNKTKQIDISNPLKWLKTVKPLHYYWPYTIPRLIYEAIGLKTKQTAQ